MTTRSQSATAQPSTPAGLVKTDATVKPVKPINNFQRIIGPWQYLEAETFDRVLVIRPQLGVLATHSEVESLRKEMTEVVRSHPSRLYLLDMVKVNFISSAFLGTLTDVNKKFRAAGVPFRVHNLRPEIAKVLRATRLDKLLDVRANLEDSLRQE